MKSNVVLLPVDITESTEWTLVSAHQTQGEVVLDMSQVQNLNSAGLRGLRAWLDQRGFKKEVSLKLCSTSVIQQLNSLSGVHLLKARVESCELPYRCPSCGHQTKGWAYREKSFLEAGPMEPRFLEVARQLSCPKCSGQLQLDVELEEYFRFLEHSD